MTPEQTERKRKSQLSYTRRPEIKEKLKAYRAKVRNTEEYRAYARQYAQKRRDENPEQRKRDREHARKYRATHPEYYQEHVKKRIEYLNKDRGPKVYFIQTASGPIKIGYTVKNPESRLMELQVGSFEPLKLLGWMYSARELELNLHYKFQSDNLRGEWFKPSEALVSEITSLMTQKVVDNV